VVDKFNRFLWYGDNPSLEGASSNRELQVALQKLLPDSIIDFSNRNIGEVDRFLGGGVYGEVYLLKDGSVIKFTTSAMEALCVESIMDIQESAPNKYKKVFPVIYEYGWIEGNYALGDTYGVGKYEDEDDVFFTAILPRKKTKDFELAYTLPIFWYRRENVHDPRNEDEAWIREGNNNRLKIKNYARRYLDVELVDYHEENWGFVDRKGKSYMVYRDIVCELELPYPIDYFNHQYISPELYDKKRIIKKK